MGPQFIDHLVIVAKDLRETERFYASFLGTPLAFREGLVAFKVGDTKLIFRPAAGEWEAIDKDRSSLNHFAFGVRTLVELKELEAVLNSADIKSNIKTDENGNMKYIWLDDPNGIRLEIFYSPE